MLTKRSAASGDENVKTENVTQTFLGLSRVSSLRTSAWEAILECSRILCGARGYAARTNLQTGYQQGRKKNHASEADQLPIGTMPLKPI